MQSLRALRATAAAGAAQPLPDMVPKESLRGRRNRILMAVAFVIRGFPLKNPFLLGQPLGVLSGTEARNI